MLSDDREVKASLAEEVVSSTEEVLKEFKSGKRKPMTLEEFKGRLTRFLIVTRLPFTISKISGEV